MEEILKQIVNKLDNLENRFDGLENRFDGLENRFDGLEKEMRDGFAQTNARLDKLEKSVSDLDVTMKTVYAQVADNTERHTEIMDRFFDVEDKIDFVTQKETDNEKAIFGLKRKLAKTV